jgi:hypothetical protein
MLSGYNRFDIRSEASLRSSCISSRSKYTIDREQNLEMLIHPLMLAQYKAQATIRHIFIHKY